MLEDVRPTSGTNLVYQVGPVFGLLLLAVVASWALIEEIISRDEEAERRAIQSNSYNIARAFGEHADGLLSGVNTVLGYVARDWLLRPDHVKANNLASFEGALKQATQQVGIIGPGGRLEYSSLLPGGVPDPVDLSDREHFRVHLNGSENRLFVSKPIIGRVSSKKSLNVSKAIRDDDGRFAGVVVVSVDPQFFVKIFSEIDVGQTGAISLVGEDGIIRARASRLAISRDSLGEAVPQDRPFLAPDAPIMGTFDAIDVTDKLERTFSYRKLPEYGVIVVTLLSHNDFLGPIQENKRRLRSVATLLTFAAASFAGFAFFANARQRRVARELAISKAEVQKSNARLKDFAGVSADWFWEQNDELRYTYISKESESISGLPTHSFYGLTTRETNPSDVSEEQWEAHDRTLKMRLPLTDFQMSRVTKSGKKRTHSISGRPYYSKDGMFLGYRGVARDVTEKIEAEQSLRILSAVVDQSPVSVVVTNLAGEIVYTNPAFTKVTGYSADEVKGKNPRILKSGLTKPEVYQDMWKVLLSGEPWRGDFVNSTKWGEAIWERMNVAPLKGQDGKPRFFVAVKENISQEKALEHDLVEARDLADSANRAKSAFLAMMSHELRTPLNAIIGFAELIRAQPHGPVGDKHYIEYAHDIEVSGRHLLEVLNDVLDITRVEIGKYPLDVRSQSLADIVKELNAALMSLAVKAGHEYKIMLDDRAEAMCDRRAVRQILLNLVSNASKYTEPGGLIQIGVSSGPSGIELMVCDNGIGMTKREVAEAMQLFTRLDNNLVRRSEGVGIGLHLVGSLASAMGAKFDLQSEPRRGTIARVIFRTGLSEAGPIDCDHNVGVS